MSGLDSTTIAAFATWLVAVGTLLILYWQTRLAQRLNSANSVLTLRERFDTPRMRRARRLLSQRLLDGKHEDITNLEVAAFFELVGALTHARLLDQRLVWEGFGTWTTGYYYALRNPVDVIGRARTELGDPLVMHEFEWLYHRTVRLDHRMIHSTPITPVDPSEESRVLLRREADLDLDEGTQVTPLPR